MYHYHRFTYQILHKNFQHYSYIKLIEYIDFEIWTVSHLTRRPAIKLIFQPSIIRNHAEKSPSRNFSNKIFQLQIERHSYL